MSEPRRYFSLAGPYAALVSVLAVALVVSTVLLGEWLPDSPVLVGALVLLAGLPLAWYLVRRQFGPMLSLFRALAGTVSSYRDGDFSFSLRWPRHDELGELVDSHNALGDVLREQRLGLVQRELLLDTMVQNTPVAMLLVAEGGPVVYGNLAARQLLNQGRKLEGHAIAELLGARGRAAARCDRPRRRRPVLGRRRGRGGDLPPRPPQLPPQRPRARAAAAAADHRRAAPAGSADLEEGDPRDQPRAQQLAGPGRLARAFGRRTHAARPARQAAGDLRHHRRARAPPRRLHPRLRAFRQAADAAHGGSGLGGFRRAPAQPDPLRGGRRAARASPRTSTSRRWSRRCSTC